MSASALAVSLNDKPRLSEQEKKNNHIASEQKRRQAIREGFDEIADIVPGLKGQGRSEAVVLQGATGHIRKLLADRHRLVEQGKRAGLDVTDVEMDEQTMKIAGIQADLEEKGRVRR